MIIFIPELSGFCPGVRRAEQRILDIRKKYPERSVYVIGYMINNRRYIQYLAGLQILTTDTVDAVPEDSLVVIRTHGIDRFEEEAIRNRYEILDLTCKNVKKVQTRIQHYSDSGYHILITGKKDHPEVKGLMSYARVSHVIENDEDREYFFQNSGALLHFPDKTNKLLIISQTTGNRRFFADTIAKAEQHWHQDVVITTIDSICPVTDKKEKQALELQKSCDVSFVIGDTLSSNAHKLYQRLSKHSDNVHFIEDAGMLKSLTIPLQDYHSALVVSSASTPVFIENEVCRFLESI
ncbi:MAG: 4-hydroxy-3-methylbut-2-enyl diphosphate reductase [Spirochaetales bacterium]|nr:4-hydroxy-3-methylbut-2-enyl diphosphate reductase [Spirochaetales bacterium]